MTTEISQKKKVWVFCFEYAGIAKVGGLGEVSANQCKCLAHDPDVQLNVFMPSHGRHLSLKDKLQLKPVVEKDGSKLILKGHWDPFYFGLTHGDEIHARSFTKFQSFTDNTYFEIEVWQGLIEDVPIFLLVGANSIATRVLNDQEVYGMETLNSKLGLFSWAMKEYMRFCIFKEPNLIPNIIHIHDHHPVAALLCCRQELNLVGRDIRTIITMHLLTWPRRQLEFYWKSGVNNEPMLIQMGVYRLMRRMSELYAEMSKDELEPPTIEKIGCAIADRVIAVSENFMNSDIIPFCGDNLIRWKSDFIWNGCDWDYNSHLKIVVDKYQDLLGEKPPETLKSWDLRKILLENIIGHLPAGEPNISGSDIRMAVCREFTAAPYHPDCRVDAFDSDGPLVLITGRVSPQKGVENIFYAIPHVVEKIPNVRFLFLMVPTPYTIIDLQNYMAFARLYPKNIRFIFGVAGSIYLLSYLAADVYCCPSRWEPFGIVALEAMASRVPLVATYVGGLMESILHLEDHPKDGCGLLCPNNDGEALKNALISLINTMWIAEQKQKQPSIQKQDLQKALKDIFHPVLRGLVEKDLAFGEKIRENAYTRVETLFRWKTTTEKLKKIYLALNY